MTTTLLRSRSTRLACVAFAALLSAACGGAKQEEAKQPEYVVEADNEPEQLEVMQDYGGMNEEKVARVFKRIQGDLAQCMLDGQKRVEFLGGSVGFYMEVDLTGRAKSAHVEQSNLGDYETEQCMLEVLRAQKWPKPVGGKLGKINSSGWTFDPPEGVRPPVQWDSDNAEKAIEHANEEMASCGGGGPFNITAYVATNGSVLSAGVAHSDDAGDKTAACLVEAIKHAKFGSPGSWPAKLTFRR